MNKRICLKYFLLVLVLSLTVSCASWTGESDVDYAVIDKAIETDWYTGFQAVQGFEEKYRSPILYGLDAGMLAFFSDEREASSALLQGAERGIEEAISKNFGTELASYFANDNATDYGGEDYEDIYLNIFNAINYQERGESDSSLVEIRRVGNKLRYLSDKYRKVLDKYEEDTKGNVIEGFPNQNPIPFYNSALARYLSMLFYRGDGDPDNAYVDLKKMREAYENQPGIYDFKPSFIDTEDDIYVPESKGRLNVLAFLDRMPKKVEKVVQTPFGFVVSLIGALAGDAPLPLVSNAMTSKVVYPVFEEQEDIITNCTIVFNSGETMKLELIEDMGVVARETVRYSQRFAAYKSFFRSLAKKTAVIIAWQQTMAQTDNTIALIFANVALYAALDLIDSTERADIRMGRYFPDRAYAAGINLEPGSYSFTAKFYDSNGNEVGLQQFTDVEVLPDRLNLVTTGMM